jgi:hypothetical protein
MILLAILGCGPSGPSRFKLSGKMTFAGKPIPAGWVCFTPDTTKGNSGPQGVAQIREGTYDTDSRNGKGTIGGPMIVRIEGFDGQATADLPDGRPIFAPYEMAVDLPRERSVKDIEIPASWAKQPIPSPAP